MKYVTAYRVTVLIALLILILGGFATVNVLWSNPSLPAAVTIYEFPVIKTNDKPLCAGDVVVYDQVAHFSDTPTTVRIVSTVWSVDQNITVIADKNVSYVNYTVPTTVRLHGEWAIPPDLPPGHYERRLFTTAEARKSQGFAVTFTVSDKCP